MFNYHSEWETGEWYTNVDEDDFEKVYINGSEWKMGGRPNLDPNMEYMMGPPKSGIIGIYESSQLESMGIVGVYKRLKVPEDPISAIAEKVREGILAKEAWIIELDIARVTANEFQMVLNNIADCIEIGVTQGICPFWKLTQYQSDFEPEIKYLLHQYYSP